MADTPTKLSLNRTPRTVADKSLTVAKGKRVYTPTAKPQSATPTHGHANRRQRRASVKTLKLSDVRDHQRALIKYWPQLYRNGRILPLCKGVRELMIADLCARGATINPKRIFSALYSATNTENYSRRTLFLKHRYDLSGAPVEKITDSERDYAYKKLAAKMTERGRTPPKEGFWKTPARVKKPGAKRSAPSKN